MCFVELYEFIIYQNLNKSTKILSLATSQIAHFATSLIMFTRPISMPRFKSIIFFIKIALKLSYFCKKMQIFRAKKCKFFVSPAAGGFAPRPLKTAPPIANSWLRA